MHRHAHLRRLQEELARAEKKAVTPVVSPSEATIAQLHEHKMTFPYALVAERMDQYAKAKIIAPEETVIELSGYALELHQTSWINTFIALFHRGDSIFSWLFPEIFSIIYSKLEFPNTCKTEPFHIRMHGLDETPSTVVLGPCTTQRRIRSGLPGTCVHVGRWPMCNVHGSWGLT